MFFTYDTKIKQIGGIGDYICIPNVNGRFDSFENCQAVPNPTTSYVTLPQFKLWPNDDLGEPLKKENFGRSLNFNPAKALEVRGKTDGENRIKRREILIKTLEKFEENKDGLYYHRIALKNLTKWAVNPRFKPTGKCVVQVIQEDWGVAAQSLTIQYGKCFAVLNMANGTHPGGGYTSGSAAQEENMFRRTDCHFSLNRASKYTLNESNQINGVHGRVYLDINKARVCIRGPEDIKSDDLGYRWLDDKDIFPFYELRAAAVNLGGGKKYSDTETHKRIAAQLDTLIAAGIRYAVLSAFGCGAFGNPADKVARVYYNALNVRRDHFDVVVFAIFYAGYGSDNYKVFAEEFKKW